MKEFRLPLFKNICYWIAGLNIYLFLKLGRKILQSHYLGQHLLTLKCLFRPQVKSTLSICLMPGVGKSGSCFLTSKTLTFENSCWRILHPVKSHYFNF